MKIILIIITVYLINTMPVLAEKNDCSEMEKISKEYLICTAKNIKATSVEKTKQISEGTKKIINKVKNKIKKKE